jgi:hypothetical protein
VLDYVSLSKNVETIHATENAICDETDALKCHYCFEVILPAQYFNKIISLEWVEELCCGLLENSSLLNMS